MGNLRDPNVVPPQPVAYMDINHVSSRHDYFSTRVSKSWGLGRHLENKPHVLSCVGWYIVGLFRHLFHFLTWQMTDPTIPQTAEFPIISFLLIHFIASPLSCCWFWTWSHLQSKQFLRTAGKKENTSHVSESQIILLPLGSVVKRGVGCRKLTRLWRKRMRYISHSSHFNLWHSIRCISRQVYVFAH
jgi:hypothetical protein